MSTTTPEVKLDMNNPAYDKKLNYTPSTSESAASDVNCPAPPKNPEAMVSQGAALLKEMNLESCKQFNTQTTAYSESEFSFYGEMDVLGGLAGSMSMGGGGRSRSSATSNASASIGCEQVGVAVQQYYQAVNKIKCVLNKNVSTVNLSASGKNTIRFEAPNGDITINCVGAGGQGFQIDQKMAFTVSTLNTLSLEQQTEIANITKAATEVIAKNIAESDTEFGATPQGQKAASELIDQSVNNDYQKDVNETIAETKIDNTAANEVVFKAGRNITIMGDQCIIRQDMLLDIQAQQFIGNSIGKVMSDYIEAAKTYESENKAKSQGEGFFVPEMPTPLPSSAQQAAEGAAAAKSASKFSGMGKEAVYIIIAIGGVLVLLAIVAGIFAMMKKKKDDTQQQGGEVDAQQSGSQSQVVENVAQYIKKYVNSNRYLM